jgi:hypothetical protein
MRIKMLLLVISIAFIAGCSHKNTKDDTAAAAPQKQEKDEKADQGKVANVEIVGTPARGSKFSKLKPGMTVKQVVAKIGPPDKEWKRPTGKAAIPFYFGADRWVIQYAYKKEGQLTFSYGGDQPLTGIVVDKTETGK